MSHWIKTREKSRIHKECCFLLSVFFTPTPSSFPSFSSPSFSLSLSHFLSPSHNKADLCLWSSSSSSPPSVWPSLINIHPSPVSRGTESDFHFLFGWSSSWQPTRNESWLSFGTNTVYIYTSVELSQCVRPRLAEFKINTINNSRRRTLKPHAWLIVVWLGI